MDISKEDVLAILKANRALGEEYDEHTAQQILDLVSASPSPTTAMDRLWAGLTKEEKERLLRRHARGESSMRILPVLGMSIPLMAVAGGAAHAAGVFAVLALDALVILSQARHH